MLAHPWLGAGLFTGFLALPAGLFVDLSGADPSRDFTTLDGRVHTASSVRFRWFSEQPPDERGIALARQRLNEKLGADIRGVVAEFDARNRPSDP